MNRSIVIASGRRTPFCKAGGALKRDDAARVGAVAARETLAQSGIDAGMLDEVLLGCVGQPFDQVNIVRVVALRAGVPQHVPAVTLGRNCASGMEAITAAATRILAGRGELFLAGGVESMSGYPLVFGRDMTDMFERLSRARSFGQRLAALARFRPWHLKPRIALVEGLTDPTCGLIMGSAVERLAREFGLSREEGDRYAVESHTRAAAARKAGRFEREIAAILPTGARDSLLADDGIREGQTLEAAARLKPYFEKPDGVVTVGNSSQVTDGACTLLVASEERARTLGLTPLARIRAFAYAGLAPARMGLGPVFATALALREAKCTVSDLGVVELNEAFAHQVLACQRAFASDAFAKSELGLGRALGELDPARLNVNGGAIALGHPVGASGARIVLTLAHEMIARDVELGLATLCIGGGQGGAVVLERVR